jgi:hypothetical protein
MAARVAPTTISKSGRIMAATLMAPATRIDRCYRKNHRQQEKK